jgi:hypothetical protein
MRASPKRYHSTYYQRLLRTGECRDHFLYTLLGKEHIRRIQLMLTDGDSKIYEPFNSVKEELYHSAIHGPCIFHLLTQQLGKHPISEKGDEDVKGMIKT